MGMQDLAKFYVRCKYLYVSTWTFLMLKGPILGLRQFLTIESPLKIMRNAFYFMLRALFVLEVFTFL